MRIRLVKQQRISLEKSSLRKFLKSMLAAAAMERSNWNKTNRYQGILRVLNLSEGLLVVLREELYRIKGNTLSIVLKKVSLILIELLEVHKLR